MEVKRNRKSTLGVIGGSGPEAGINVVEKMLFIHKVGMGETYMSDKDAVSIILMQDPGIGGPHGNWDLGDPNDEAFLKLIDRRKRNSTFRFDSREYEDCNRAKLQ